MNRKRYFKFIDYIRAVLCIAVLLYHVGLLPGGYLAVCGFFSLSGYLTCKSLSSNKERSLADYYKGRFVKIYLPLACIVLTTIAVLSFLPEILWISLKPETTSVLLGYNNFWQISANLDYFARHTDSPFMHLWYIAILLQFELFFPLVFTIFEKISEKIKGFTSAMLNALAIVTAGVFLYFCFNKSLTEVYYNTFSRLFSLIFGAAAYYSRGIFKKKLEKMEDKQKKVLFGVLMLASVAMYILVLPSSKAFAAAMIAMSLIVCAQTELAVNISTNSLKKGDIPGKLLSDISYELYLVQYPVIFIYQALRPEDSNGMRAPWVILISVVLAMVFHYSTGRIKKASVPKLVSACLAVLVSCYGGYVYATNEDFTKEMKLLQEQMAQNEELMKSRQEAVAKKAQEDAADWDNILSQIEIAEQNFDDVIKNLSITAIGDSVMLGASSNICETFPNCYCDAEVSRSGYTIGKIITALKADDILSSTVVIHTGTNGVTAPEVLEKIMEDCEGCDVFWINASNDDVMHSNGNIRAIVDKYDNAYLIDWDSFSDGHKEFFYYDGIHLNPEGRAAYTQLIYDSLYPVYQKQYEEKKAEIIHRREIEEKSKISFYGNDFLMGVYEPLSANFPNAIYQAKSDYSFDALKADILAAEEAGIGTHRIVFLFDQSKGFSEGQYAELTELCEGKEIFIITRNHVNRENLGPNKDDAAILDCSEIFKDHPEYFMADRVHLTESGNMALNTFITENIPQSIEAE